MFRFDIFMGIITLAIGSTAVAQSSVNGHALCIGLNSVDPDHYGGWAGYLTACEFDAEDMAAIAADRGFTVQKLKTAAATREAVLAALSTAATKLNGGDIFVVSYSGHGGQLNDGNGDESDNLDETWCLFNGEIIDDELAAAWKAFKPGVRIVVYSDSCHSGTVTRVADYDRMLDVVAFNPVEVRVLKNRFSAILQPSVNDNHNVASPIRLIPPEIADITYRQNRNFYDKLSRETPSERDSTNAIKATVLLISGCEDNQLSLDGTLNGLFTGTLKQVWGNGAFSSSHPDFRQAILDRMPPYQSPNYYVIGAPNAAFESQQPWTK